MVDSAISRRLVNGARVLGVLAKESKCESGWALECACPQPSEFCRAKILWILLASQEGRERFWGDVSDPFGLPLAMDLAEITSSGLTATVESDSGEKTLVGGRAGRIAWRDFAGLTSAPAATGTAIMILDKFPGSVVVSKIGGEHEEAP